MSTLTLPEPVDTHARRLLDTLPSSPGGAELWRALGAENLLSRVYRDHDPRHGIDPAALGALLSELDRRCSLGSTLAVTVPLATCLPLMASSTGLASSVLEAALGGRCVVALAATDESAGCDLASLGTEITFDDDGLYLHGTKRWITNATTCDAALVLARHRPGPHFTNFTWVLVPTDAPGVSAEPADTQLFEGSGTGHLTFDRVRVGHDHVVGGKGRGMSAFAAHIATERLAGALWAVALCERTLRDTARHLRERRRGDGTLWQHEGIRQRYASALLRARQHRALTENLTQAVAARRDSAAAATLKASAALTVEEVLDVCAHLEGAHGFRTGGPQALRAQAALFGIGGGTTEVVLSIMADAAPETLAEPGS
ncbi:acyl-CoA dehydrogenase family protein [Streptomyces sp. NPDC093598]|uniref:acyl-CoA dehydrogenase family protein n=1 Tax=Streptomyces sp. NPDC093598 TaxID=3366046 RepID=UPI00380A3E38